jgi:hypothetical protein
MMSFPPFRQIKVPCTKKILDFGVTNLEGEKLIRTKDNTPKVGNYYVSERTGVYIFATTDTVRSLRIKYLDVTYKNSHLKDFMVKSLRQINKEKETL